MNGDGNLEIFLQIFFHAVNPAFHGAAAVSYTHLMLSQPWGNNACRGYVIYAMENCGFSPNDIRRVVAELYEVFDIRSLEEAQQHFEESPY